VGKGEVESKSALDFAGGSLGLALDVGDLDRTSGAFDFQNSAIGSCGSVEWEAVDDVLVCRGDGGWQEEGLGEGGQSGSGSELREMHVGVDSRGGEGYRMTEERPADGVDDKGNGSDRYS